MRAEFDSNDIAGATKGAIESFDYIDGAPALVVHPRPSLVPLGAPVAVAGWAVASRSNDAPREVTVVLDRHRPHFAQCGLARTDVAERHGTDERVGFRCVIPTDDLLPGAHELRVYALGTGGGWFEAAQTAFRLYEGVRSELAPHGRAVGLKVDFVGDLHAGKAGNGKPIPSGKPALLAGWAFDPVTQSAPAGVIAIDENGSTWSGPCGNARPDVAASFGAAETGLGFEVVIPTDGLRRGRHTIWLAAFDAKGRRFAGSETVTLDIAGAERRFPLTASALGAVRAFGASLSTVDDDELRTLFFPSGNPIVDVARGQAFVLEGWAIRRDGTSADEIFAEIAPSGIVVPPHRHAALAGFRRDVVIPRGLLEPPVEDGWFRSPFGTAELRPGNWNLSLVVVEPGRRGITRSPLATLRVSAADRDAEQPPPVRPVR